MSERLKDASNLSPLSPIHSVLLAPPGTEAVMGLSLPPQVSLFESDSPGSSIVAARVDHERMRNELASRGVEVYNMRGIIGTKLAERQNVYASKSALLSELTKRAEATFDIYQLGNKERTMQEIEQTLDDDISTLGLNPALAINAALTNCVDAKGNPVDFDPDNPPIANFMFWRDAHHVLGNDIVTHKMYHSIRQQEVVLAQLGFDALGLRYKQMFINREGGSIEGGDILTVEVDGSRYALIGRAERTSEEAVESWYETHEDLWRADGEGIIPVVVEGPTTNTQDQMHLDTFFQQIGENMAIHCGEITEERRASILIRREGEIVKIDTETFVDWVEGRFQRGLNMTREEQLVYAPNVLVDGGETVYITRDGAPRVTRYIQENVAETVLLQMNDLTKMYGGAHCATSEFR